MHAMALLRCCWPVPLSQQRSGVTGMASLLPLLALQHLEAKALLAETLHKQVTKMQAPLQRPFPTFLSELLFRPAQRNGQDPRCYGTGCLIYLSACHSPEICGFISFPAGWSHFITASPADAASLAIAMPVMH